MLAIKRAERKEKLVNIHHQADKTTKNKRKLKPKKFRFSVTFLRNHIVLQ